MLNTSGVPHTGNVALVPTLWDAATSRHIGGREQSEAERPWR